MAVRAEAWLCSCAVAELWKLLILQKRVPLGYLGVGKGLWGPNYFGSYCYHCIFARTVISLYIYIYAYIYMYRVDIYSLRNEIKDLLEYGLRGYTSTNNTVVTVYFRVV